MGYKKGIAHLFVIVVIFLLIIVIPLLLAKFVFKKKLPFIDNKKPTVALKTQYANPFDKKTQYENPFDDFKNPFVNIE